MLLNSRRRSQRFWRGAARASAVTGASRKLHESAAGLVFLRCLGEASAGYAGQALYSSSVWVTPLVDMLARPCIPLCWICWSGLVFLRCLGDTSAGCAGQALYSSNVWVTPLLDILARPCIPPVGRAVRRGVCCYRGFTKASRICGRPNILPMSG